MNKKHANKKDSLDEHEEWQRHQFDPGHFTGGRIPGWIKNPGKRKRLGSILFILGLFYGGWALYNIITFSKVEESAEQIISSIFLSFATIIFLWAGIKLMKKTKNK